MREEDAYIALNTLPGIGPANFQNLLKKFKSASAVFRAARGSLGEVKGIGPKTVEQIKGCDPVKTAEGELETAHKLGVSIISSLSEQYPKNLKLSFYPPPVLYVDGEFEETDIIAVAIVGTRNLSPYGRIAAEKISHGLATRGITIVSGFARGVDTFAHKTAVENRGRTIAILGSGLDRLYPPENRELYAKVKECGAMVSQFPFGTEPDKRNFPIRNRVISGLSLGTVVVEAGEKSGALITAYASLEEGREVFSVPGRIDSTKSIGTNRLIQKGAKLIMSAEEVIEEFLPEVKKLIESNVNGVDTDRSPKGGEGNGKDENEILGYLNGVEHHIDFLIEKTGLPSGVLLGLLLEMELKGLVKQLPGKIYCKV